MPKNVLFFPNRAEVGVPRGGVIFVTMTVLAEFHNMTVPYEFVVRKYARSDEYYIVLIVLA